MTVHTKVMRVISSTEESGSIVLADGLCLQVIPSVRDLAKCQKYQFAAFVASEQALVVWDDDPYHLIDRAAALEEQLLKLKWGISSMSGEKSAGAEVSSIIVTDIPSEAGNQDPETAGSETRSTRLQAPVMVAATMALLVSSLGLGWRQLANEYRVDPRYAAPRLALLVVGPVQAFMSLVRLARGSSIS